MILVDVGFVQVDVDVRLVLILSLQSRRIINEVGPLDIHSLRVSLTLAQLDLAPGVIQEVNQRVADGAVGDVEVWVFLLKVIPDLPHRERAAFLVRLDDEVVDGLQLVDVQ